MTPAERAKLSPMRRMAYDKVEEAFRDLFGDTKRVLEAFENPTQESDRNLTVLALTWAAQERPVLLEDPDDNFLRLIGAVANGAALGHLERHLPKYDVPMWCRMWCRMVQAQANSHRPWGESRK